MHVWMSDTLDLIVGFISIKLGLHFNINLSVIILKQCVCDGGCHL